MLYTWSQSERHDVLSLVPPVLELTPCVRPLLLSVTSLPRTADILFGLLYHREQQAIQARLSFPYPSTQLTIVRTSAWFPVSRRPLIARYKKRVMRRFEAMTAKLGGTALQLEFAPGVSDEEVIAVLQASGMPRLLH